jgi:hypothetical protein
MRKVCVNGAYIFEYTILLNEGGYKRDPKHARAVIYVRKNAAFGNLLIYIFIFRFTYINFTERLDEAMDCENRLTSDFL